MLHRFGRRTPVADDIVGLILACHGRIRTFIHMEIVIGESVEALTDDLSDGAMGFERSSSSRTSASHGQRRGKRPFPFAVPLAPSRCRS